MISIHTLTCFWIADSGRINLTSALQLQCYQNFWGTLGFCLFACVFELSILFCFLICSFLLSPKLTRKQGKWQFMKMIKIKEHNIPLFAFLTIWLTKYEPTAPSFPQNLNVIVYLPFFHVWPRICWLNLNPLGNKFSWSGSERHTPRWCSDEGRTYCSQHVLVGLTRNWPTSPQGPGYKYLPGTLALVISCFKGKWPQDMETEEIQYPQPPSLPPFLFFFFFFDFTKYKQKPTSSTLPATTNIGCPGSESSRVPAAQFGCQLLGPGHQPTEQFTFDVFWGPVSWASAPLNPRSGNYLKHFLLFCWLFCFEKRHLRTRGNF